MMNLEPTSAAGSRTVDISKVRLRFGSSSPFLWVTRSSSLPRILLIPNNKLLLCCPLTPVNASGGFCGIGGNVPSCCVPIPLCFWAG